MAISSIEWTEMTWNPLTGCNKISAGCKFCYAERMAFRLKEMGVHQYRNGFELTLQPQTLTQPFNWRAPKVVFVNSMSDLFHKDVPLEYIQKVFEVMNKTPRHTYQVLTKRADRLAEISDQLDWTPNIWMGVSVEAEKVSWRIQELAKTGAKVKFLSVEPLIAPVKNLYLENIDWVIVGGESGPKARPMKKIWVDYVKAECERMDVPFFFKQWGKPQFNVDPSDPTIDKNHPKHAKGGCSLDGEIYREMPERLVAA